MKDVKEDVPENFPVPNPIKFVFVAAPPNPKSVALYSTGSNVREFFSKNFLEIHDMVAPVSCKHLIPAFLPV